MIGFIRSPFAKFVLKLLVVASIASLMLYGLNILLSYRVGVSRQLTLLKDLQNSDPYGKAHSSLVYNKVVDGGLVDLSDDTEDVENVKITKWIDMYVVDEHHEGKNCSGIAKLYSAFVVGVLACDIISKCYPIGLNTLASRSGGTSGSLTLW